MKFENIYKKDGKAIIQWSFADKEQFENIMTASKAYKRFYQAYISNYDYILEEYMNDDILDMLVRVYGEYNIDRTRGKLFKDILENNIYTSIKQEQYSDKTYYLYKANGTLYIFYDNYNIGE